MESYLHIKSNINIKANLAGKTDLMNKYISSIVYFFVEHNINNSRIVTQGFAMRGHENTISVRIKHTKILLVEIMQDFIHLNISIIR